MDTLWYYVSIMAIAFLFLVILRGIMNFSKSNNIKNEECWIYGNIKTSEEKFLIENEIKKIYHLTYRSHFPSLSEKNKISSDSGWGCMLRSGQMLLANTFRLIHERINGSYVNHNEILRMFIDHSRHEFSIHNLVKEGEKHNIEIGNRFGPSAICNSLKNIVNRGNFGLKIHVIMEMLVISDIDEIMINDFNALKSGGCGNAWVPLLLILSIMPRIDKIPKKAQNMILQLQESSNFAGMVGGVGGQAYYFYGKIGSKLLYLDPHKTKKVEFDEEKFRKSCVCSSINTKKTNDLASSLSIGFLFFNRDQLLQWCNTYSDTIKDVCFISDATIDSNSLSLNEDSNFELIDKSNGFEFI